MQSLLSFGRSGPEEKLEWGGGEWWSAPLYPSGTTVCIVLLKLLQWNRRSIPARGSTLMVAFFRTVSD